MIAPNVGFVFAHQDDEIGVLPRIYHEAAGGSQVWCVYLTDGASAVPASVRDAESVAVLADAGVDRSRIAFVGLPNRIADGTLANHTGRALDELLAWAGDLVVTRLYTLDWEGGHPDHDACHLVALAFAQARGVRDVFAFSLYNGWRRPKGLFRVASFVPGTGNVERRKLTMTEALRPVRALGRYPSQRRTWLGLGPGLAVRAIVCREERLRRADPRRVAAAPHSGTLLYEAMFGVRSDDVLAATAPFRKRIVSSAAGR